MRNFIWVFCLVILGTLLLLNGLTLATNGNYEEVLYPSVDKITFLYNDGETSTLDTGGNPDMVVRVYKDGTIKVVEK